VYGPRGRPDQVVKSFVERIARDLPPIIFGDGEQTRDFTYVSDIVEANLLAAESEGVSGEAFNIGSGERVSINRLAEMIIDLMGKTEEISPTHEKPYLGDFPHTCADITKASRDLGYTPRVKLDKGLENFISWYQAKVNP
ncbi:MAG: GDP-mannose 4,6-dehydratase, partial [Candidatus Bathyarchaeota archaeon]